MKEIEIVPNLQMRGLRLFLDTVEYRTPHLHKELELIWVLDGEMEIRSAQGSCLAGREDIAVLNAKQTHEFCKHGKACTFLCIQVSPQLFAYSFPTIHGLQFAQTLLPGSAHRMAPLLEALTLAYLRQEKEYEIFCAGQMHLLLHQLLRLMPHRALTESEALEQERKGERLNRLIDFVEQNHHHKISLSDFARQENRSMSWLSHFVKENLGQSFQDYVNTVRFQTACSLIAAGRERMTDVCAESGFSDYRYFSQTFRRRVGMTPEEYREKRGLADHDTLAADRLPPDAPRTLERFYTQQESILLFKQLRHMP